MTVNDDFVQILIEDLVSEIKSIGADSSQIQRRSVIRSGFATVEGTVNMIKQVILSDLHLNPGLHSEAEVAMLREESYLIDNRGNVRTQPKFIPTDANLQFAIKMWCRGTNDGLLDLSNEGWQAFKSSLKLRNRLLHPKQITDLNVSDNELFEFLKAMRWFADIFNQSVDEVLAVAQTAE